MGIVCFSVGVMGLELIGCLVLCLGFVEFDMLRKVEEYLCLFWVKCVGFFVCIMEISSVVMCLDFVVFWMKCFLDRVYLIKFFGLNKEIY